ncbi:MAG TPA: tRNA dihydrouridine synthase DusB [Gammaproteobacteria bacterium]
MRIGPYTLRNNLVLAPMAGVTDRPFRLLCRRFGAGLAVSEMVSSNSLLWGSEKTKRRADHRGEPAPRSVQLLGTDPAMMATAAQYNVDHGAEIIDINMGCPAKKVCNVAAGSALLRDPALVARILAAVVAAVPVPVTLKIRTGWDRDSRNALEIARIAVDSGIQALAIHGRTRADGYSGEAEHETVRAVAAAVPIPVIANGDIRSPEDAQRVLAESGAAAVMIGRAAQGRPWLFAEIEHYLATGEHLPPMTPAAVHAVLAEHLEALYDFYGERTGVQVARKHAAWYSRGLPNATTFRTRVVRAETPAAQLALVADYFAGVGDAVLAA